MKHAILAAVILLVGSVSLSAQWAKFQEAGVPRDAQGRVRMDAPPPRTARRQARPLWQLAESRSVSHSLRARRALCSRERESGRRRRRGAAGADVPSGPEVASAGCVLGSRDECPRWPPAHAVGGSREEERMASDMKDNPDANCMPMGITQFHMQPQPRKIVQTPKLIVILYESNYGLRYIYTDGRQLPPAR